LNETFDGMMATKYKLVGNGSIGSINVVPPTFNTKLQSPFSNLFQKVTPKFVTHMYNPTLSRGKKVVTKAKPTIKMIVRYLNTSTRSQCIYLKLLLAKS
jgi:hypothetical protein